MDQDGDVGMELGQGWSWDRDGSGRSRHEGDDGLSSLPVPPARPCAAGTAAAPWS